MWIRKYFLLLVFSVCALMSQAQSLHKVKGTYTYYAPENVSPMEAKKIALERARLQALADEFGTTLSQHNATLMQTSNEGQANTNFTSLSSSDVKGEWVEDIGEPEYTTPVFKDGMMIITCTVHGKAREIVSSKIDVNARILRNGLEDRNEDDNFFSGDDLFMSYQAPKDMYVAAYLIDTSNEAYCLLPYMSNTSGQVIAKGGKRNVYFSEKTDKSADEYTMTCGAKPETNYIYIITSPHAFTKANDAQNDENLPRELSLDKFQNWLNKLRVHDKDLQVVIKTITVKPKAN